MTRYTHHTAITPPPTHTHTHVPYQVIKRIPGVRYVVAPYEADAQLGFLARNGHVDAVITEDSDIILFGCTRVVFKLDRDGTGQEVDLREVFSRR